MARKPTGNEPETNEPKVWGELLKWHMARGTRPDGTPDVEGVPWTVPEFAAKLGVDERNVRNWRSGRPTEFLNLIEQVLFGESASYVNFRSNLRRAHRLAKNGSESIPIGPQSPIHDPGLCCGRDGEIARLVAKLVSVQEGGSILVLGDAGHGKTTLTEKVGVHPDIIQRFGSRRWFVELETANSAEEALAKIAQALGLERTAPLPAVQAHFAAKKPGLVVLDNLETPLHSDESATQRLLCDLTATPGVALMASLRSRESIAGVPWTDQVGWSPCFRILRASCFSR